MGALLFPDRVSGERYDFARHRDGNPPGDFSRDLAGSCGRLDTTVRTHALRHLDQQLTLVPDNRKSAWKARLQQPRGMPYGTGPSRKRLVQGALAKAPKTRQPERRKPGVHCVWDHFPEMALTAEQHSQLATAYEKVAADRMVPSQQQAAFAQ